MKKLYRVFITQTIEYNIDVEAEDESDAYDRAKDAAPVTSPIDSWFELDEVWEADEEGRFAEDGEVG
jgi:hypothetical protein